MKTKDKIKFLLLGMAIQAISSGTLGYLGTISLSFGQQITAGVLFLLLFAVIPSKNN